MSAPGGNDNDAMESSKRQRVLEFRDDSHSVAINQFEDITMSAIVPNNSTNAANSAAELRIADALHKRKASSMESTESSGLQLSYSESRQAQTMRAIKDQLSAFLSELHRRVVGGDISQDWADALLIEAAQMRSSNFI